MRIELTPEPWFAVFLPDGKPKKQPCVLSHLTS